MKQNKLIATNTAPIDHLGNDSCLKLRYIKIIKCVMQVQISDG